MILCAFGLLLCFGRQASGYNIFVDYSQVGHDTAIIPALLSWGNTVTAVADYGGEDLSNFDIVMDFDFDSYHPLTAQERAAYTNALNRGSGLYLQGERPTGTYVLRDASVLNYLSYLGAGNITVDWRDIFYNIANPYEQALATPVTRNTNLTYKYDTSLMVLNPGNGFFVVHTNEIAPYAAGQIYGDFSNIIGFDKGQLLNAPNGRLIGFFDITYLDPAYGWDTNQYIFKEIVNYLGDSKTVSLLGSNPSSVPEPGSIVLFLAGGVLWAVRAKYLRK